MYCYLCWFPPHRRAYAKRKFGANPFVSDVLLQLYVDYEESYLVSKPIVVGPQQLHVKSGFQKITLAEMFLTYASSHMRVGMSGYCYLKWFEDLAFPEWKIYYYRTRLGSYPLLQDVFAVLMRETSSLNMSVRYFRPTCRYGLVHVYDEELVWRPIYSIIHASREFMKQRFLIGATPSQLNNELARSMLSMAGVNHDEAVKSMLTERLKDPKSEEVGNLMKALFDITCEQLSRDRPKVYIRARATPLQQSRLAELYPEFQLDFSKSGSLRGHAMAANIRLCNTELILMRLNYNNKVRVMEGYDSWIKDVGGNLLLNLNRGWFAIHACLPILDARDNQRRSNEMLAVNQVVYRNPVIREQFNKGDNNLFCNCRAQFCCKKAPYLMFNDSIYDMTNRDVANALDASAAEVAYASFLFQPEILLTNYDCGELSDVGMVWRKIYGNCLSDDAIREGNKYVTHIEFYFKNDYSFSYRHKYRTYLQSVLDMRYVSERGILYIGEIVESRGPYIILKIVKTIYDSPASELAVVIPLSENLLSKIVVQYYTYEPLIPDAYGEFKVNFSQRSMIVPRHLYDAGLKYALAQTQAKFSNNAIFEYLRSIATRLVVNGMDASMQDLDMKPLDLYHLSDAIYLLAFNERYNSSTAISIISDYIKKNRKSRESSLFMRVIKKIFSNLLDSVPFILDGMPSQTTHIKTHDLYLDSERDEPTDLTLLQKLSIWAAAPEYFSIKIKDATKILEVRNLVEEVTYDYSEAYFNPRRPDSNKSPVRFSDDVEEMADIIMEKALSIVQRPNCSDSSTEDVPNEERNVGFPVLEAPYSEVNCEFSGLHEVESVPGDGNCLFYCLKDITSETVPELKIRLLESNHLASCMDPAEVIDVLTSERKWGTDDIILLFCREQGVNICVHNQSEKGISCLLFRGNNTSKVAKHLLLRDNHFSPIKTRVQGGFEVDHRIYSILPPPTNEENLIDPIRFYVSRLEQPKCEFTGDIANACDAQLVEIFSHYPQLVCSNAVIRADFNAVVDTESGSDCEIVLTRMGFDKVQRHDYTGSDATILSASEPATACQDLMNDNNLVLRMSDWMDPRLDAKLEYLSKRFRDVEVFKPEHSWIHTGIVYVICTRFGVNSCKVSWQTSRENLMKNLCITAISGEVVHKCDMWDRANKSLDYEEFVTDDDLCYELTPIEEGLPLFQESDTNLINSLEALDSGCEKDFGSRLELCGSDVSSVGKDTQRIIPLKISGRNIFYHPSEYLIPPLVNKCREKESSLNLKIGRRNIFYKDPRKFSINKVKPLVCWDEEDHFFNIGKISMFTDKKKYYRFLGSKEYFQPATVRSRCLGLIKTKTSSQGIKRTSLMGITISRREINLPNPIRSKSLVGPGSSSKSSCKEPIVKTDPGKGTNSITMILPDAETKDIPRLSPSASRKLVLYERDKDNFDRVGAINCPVSEVPVLNALQESHNPNGVELIFVDENDQVLLGSRYLANETVSNISRALYKSGSISADRLFTLFSHDRMLCVAKFLTADFSLELSNIVRILGCLYPDTRSFYFNKITDIIDVASLVAIFDNYLCSYPHKFLTVGETIEDCRYVVDHYHRFKRALTQVSTAEQKVSALWERSNSTYVKFSPGYEPGYTTESCVRNSAREIREYWKISANIVYGVYKKFYDLYCRRSSLNLKYLREACDLSSEKFRVVRLTINPASEELVIHPVVSSSMSEGLYEVFFDGAKFVQWEDLKSGSIPITDRNYLTGKSLKLMQELLYNATKEVNISAVTLSYVNINFVQGVPGCGKTHCIVENVPLDVSKEVEVRDDSSGTTWKCEVKPCLVLTPTRESAEEIKTRLAKKGLDRSDLRHMVMTIDSFLLNYTRKGKLRYDLLIVEEALMLHAGQIVLALTMTGARSLMFIGDEKQIPFINRLGHCHLKYSDPLQVFPNASRRRLNVSFRCTASVAAVLNPKYTDGMFSVNNISGECRNRKYLGVSDIDKPKTNVVYLTFKQSEKDELIKKKFEPVYTVHEFQGKQGDNVVVIRISTKKEEIYSSEEHALVAFSRHKKTLVYYSPVHDDALGKLVSRASSLHSMQIKKVLRAPESVESPVIENLVPPVVIDALIDKTIEVQRGDDKVGDLIQVLEGKRVCNNAGVRKNRSFIRLEGGYLRPIEQSLRNFNDVTEAIYSVTKKYRDYDLPTVIPVSHVGDLPKSGIRPTVLVPNLELADISLLQIFYDQVLPGNSQFDYSYDPLMVQTGDINLNLEDTEFNPEYKFNNYKTLIFDKLRPNLRTSMPVNRPNTQVESLLAMIKRNQSVPDLGGFSDIDALSDIMLRRFNALLKPEEVPMLKIFRANPIVPNGVSVRNWLLTQSGETLDAIEQPDDILVRQHSNYKFMIKSNVKPQLDTSAPYSYSALQTIAYSDKSINVNYCPMFRELVDRVTPMLRDHLVVNTGMTPENLNDKLTQICQSSNLRISKATALEVDMSKFDKSQGELMLAFEEKFLRQFGFDEEFIISWVRSHRRSILTDISNRVRCRVSYQRKSGDASTFTMNTFYLMAMLATLLPLEDAKLACFSGDDSLILGGSEFNVNLSSITAILFNMESKYFRTYKYNYFCSKFIIQDRDGFVKLVPDPVKLVTKFGRHDIANWEHLEEYRISLEDLTKAYSNALDYSDLSAAVCERYNVKYSVDYIFPVIYNFCRNKELFASLFFSRPGDRLCLDPTLSKFD